MAADAQVIDMSDLKDLEPLSKRLNAATEELNQTLHVIQERLNALGIGLEVHVKAALETSDWEENPDSSSAYTTHRLGYGRLGDGWGLTVQRQRHVKTWNNDDHDWDVETYDEGEQSLLKASRKLRVEAVRLIPTLIETLEREATVVIDRVEQAKKIADSLK